MTDRDLLETIESIRETRFPNLPGNLVRDILLIESEYTENRTEAYRRVIDAIDTYLADRASGQITGLS